MRQSSTSSSLVNTSNPALEQARRNILHAPPIRFYVLYKLTDGIFRLHGAYIHHESAQRTCRAFRQLPGVKMARVVRSDRLRVMED